MTMRTLMLLSVLTFLGCGTQNMGSPGPIEFSNVGMGELHGNGAEGIEASQQVISDPVAWARLLDKMDSVNDESSSFDLRGFDFSNRQLLAVFDTVRSHGGYAIEITGITENEEALLVEVKATAASGANIQVMIQPYHIVSIPKTDKPILFQ